MARVTAHSNGVSKAFFEELLALFAREAGAGNARFIILVIDGALLLLGLPLPSLKLI